MNATISVDISYGRYVWCGNMDAPPDSGFFLNPTNAKDQYGEPRTYFLVLVVEMNDILFRHTDIIDLYDCTRFLFGYSRYPNKSNTVYFYKKLDAELISTDLTVKFRKILPRNSDKRMFCRPPMDTIFEQVITIPNLVLKSDTICKICLEEVSDNEYISPCGHILHMNCLWSYLEHSGSLMPTNERCMGHLGFNDKKCPITCCGSRKYQPFTCVYCNRSILR